MKRLTIAVDVDDVCADLLSEWLLRYNVEHGDSLAPKDIDRWNFGELTKIGDKIYEYLNLPDLYDGVQPHEGALAAVDMLRKAGHRVLFVSSCGRNSYAGKWSWLEREGFLPKSWMQKDFIACSDKALIRADVLIDDHVENLRHFPGHRILVRRPHNRHTRGDIMAEAVDGLLEAAVRLVRRHAPRGHQLSLV